MYENYDKSTRKAVLKLYRSADNLGTEELAAELSPHRFPALVVWGAADPYVPVKYAEMQRQYFAVDRVVILQDSGHWPMIDNPVAVRDAVIPFLKSQVSKA
jgi:pimeloyl-ACP methyl ester carboxylesterase